MKSASYAMMPLCGAFGAKSLLASLEDQIIDFLDGRTHGESLLHALYDHILDEPIPERMCALFNSESPVSAA